MTPGWVRTVNEMEAAGYEVMLTSSMEGVQGWAALFGYKGKKYSLEDIGVGSSKTLAVKRAAKKAKERGR